MTKVHVEVSEEHLRKHLKSARQGLIELIDNALDSDATRVEVDLVRTEAEAIKAVVVRDNGEGMSEPTARRAFGEFGNSWKVNQPRTRRGRHRRGRRGTGRWAAFSIGDTVTWTSTTHPVMRIDMSYDTSTLAGTRVTGSARTIGEFDVEAVAPEAATGTVVTVDDVTDTGQQVDEMARVLTGEYALMLCREPGLTIVYDGHELRASDVMLDSFPVPVDLPDPEEAPELAHLHDDNGDAVVRLTVVEWAKKAKHVRPVLVFTDAAGNPLHDHHNGLPRASWPYTAYLAWDGFTAAREHLGDDLGYTPGWAEDMKIVVTAALDALTGYVRGRRDQDRARLVAGWKADGSYPYADDPHGALEEAERDLFDVIAVTAAPVLEDMDPAARTFSLRLMREALTSDPTQLGVVLASVLNLDEDQLTELHDLLERTTLPALITAGKVVTHRLDITNGLQQLLHDIDEAQNVLERDHLHKIVAEEPWLFGDEYTVAVNEKSLTEVLRAHQRILGSERVILDPGSWSGPDLAPVLVSGKAGRVDLMLSRVSPLSSTVHQHLVVELKRPGLIGAEEITQLKKYAYEIRKDSRFHHQDVRWDFVLIGTRLDPFAQDEAEQLELSATPEFKVRVMTWNQLLQSRLHQLNFVQDALNVTTSADAGVDRLRTIHGAHLPPSVTGDQAPTGT